MYIVEEEWAKDVGHGQACHRPHAWPEKFLTIHLPKEDSGKVSSNHGRNFSKILGVSEVGQRAFFCL